MCLFFFAKSLVNYEKIWVKQNGVLSYFSTVKLMFQNSIAHKGNGNELLIETISLQSFIYPRNKIHTCTSVEF